MKATYTVAFILAWMVPLFWEIAILAGDFWQILNPFLQFKVLWWTITTPIWYVFLIVGFIFLHLDIKRKSKTKVDHNI
jgi:uncharacterized BrkB/YihY/UPF0761 family membrane protein